MTTAAPATHRYDDDDRSPLVLHEISIFRAPGISPGFTLKDLSPDITIVFGPNASGKSTTARAIQSVLWPHPSSLRGHHLAASFTLSGEEWSIDASASSVQRYRNGSPADAPLIAPLDDRARYSLSLPDLLASENLPLAQAILNESSGGFDLPQIAESLHFHESIPARLEAANRVHTATVKLQQVIATEHDLQQQLNQRAELGRQRDDSHAAERDITAIDTALDYRRLLAKEAEIEAEVRNYPQEVHTLTGDESELIAAISQRILQQTSMINNAMRQRDNLQQKIDATGLAGVDNPAGQLKTLQRLQEQQSEIETRLGGVEHELVTAESERSAHQQRLANDLNDEQITALDSTGMREFANIAASYESIRARRTARDEVELWLGGVQPPENLDALGQGVETLQARLQHPNANEHRALTIKSRWVGIGSGLLVAAAGGVLAVVVNPLWWILAAVGILLIFFAWTSTSSKSPQQAAELEQTYSSLPLPQPEIWRMPHIQTTLTQLREDFNIAWVEQEKADRWQDLEQERAELDQAYADTEARRTTAIAAYGVAPDLKEESLRLIAENLGRWQAADASVRGLDGRLQRLTADQSLLHARRKTLLNGLGYSDDDQINHLDDIYHRIELLNEANAHRDEVRQSIETSLQPQLEELTVAYGDIFATVNLEPGDGDGMRALQHQRQQLAATQARLTSHRNVTREVWESLGLTPHWRENDAEQLVAAGNKAVQIADQRSAIEKEMRRLNDLERSAMRAHAREHAQTEVDTAKFALMQERDRVMSGVVGELLLITVRQETRDASLPIVFHRARELFAIITRGKYELQFETGPPPEFTTLDTATGITLSLDQLSSGTRVQLLMAIRLAFVENVEVGPRLPVILDETLGNSDEFRASAIIDAAIDISRRGRQVFYFTAQGEEVARWLRRVESMVEKDRPKIRVIELAEIRQDAGFERLPIPALAESSSSALPSPADYDTETWAAALRVPGLDPWVSSTGSAHLWHVLPHPEILYALLQEDISTIGQLESLERTNPDQLDLIHPDVSAHLHGVHTRTQLLRNAMQMWRIGRARPMPIGVLADADMIDGAALAEMHALQADAGNDGLHLLHRLQTMDDAPLAEKPLEALELWMISEGYIAQGSSMRDADIRARIIEMASAAIRSGELESQDTERLMELVRSW